MASESDPHRDDWPPAEKRIDPMSQQQVQRLIRLAKSFDDTVDRLPDEKGEKYKREQQQIAETRRKAQMSDGLLRLRVQ